jgi:hypothetical protein
VTSPAWIGEFLEVEDALLAIPLQRRDAVALEHVAVPLRGLVSLGTPGDLGAGDVQSAFVDILMGEHGDHRGDHQIWNAQGEVHELFPTSLSESHMGAGDPAELQVTRGHLAANRAFFAPEFHAAGAVAHLHQLPREDR